MLYSWPSGDLAVWGLPVVGLRQGAGMHPMRHLGWQGALLPWSWMVGRPCPTPQPYPFLTLSIGRLQTRWWGPTAEVAKLKKTTHVKRGLQTLQRTDIWVVKWSSWNKGFKWTVLTLEGEKDLVPMNNNRQLKKQSDRKYQISSKQKPQ